MGTKSCLHALEITQQRFLLNTPQLSWTPATFWPPSIISPDSFYGITFVPPGEVLDRRSVQTTALLLWKLKQPVEFLLSFSHPTAVRSIHTVGSNEASSQFSQDCQAIRYCSWDIIALYIYILVFIKFVTVLLLLFPCSGFLATRHMES